MDENMDFGQIFESIALENAELAAKAEKATATSTVKDGLAYVGDFESENGHDISRYAMTMAGKHVFDVLVDNFVETTVPEDMGKVPAGVTAHAIIVALPGDNGGFGTAGIALRTPHPEGTHIDGRTVQSYIYPRAVRLLVQLYV